MKEVIDEDNNNIINTNNESFMLKSKTFEMKDYDSNVSRQESITSMYTLNENANEIFNETSYLDFLNLENPCVNSPFIIYFEYFMSIILFANSFIFYSFLNIIHLGYSFFLIYTKYSTMYSCYMRNKGRMTLTVLLKVLLTCWP